MTYVHLVADLVEFVEVPLLVKLVGNWLVSDFDDLLGIGHMILQMNGIVPSHHLLLDLRNGLCYSFVVQLGHSLLIKAFHHLMLLLDLAVDLANALLGVSVQVVFQRALLAFDVGLDALPEDISHHVKWVLSRVLDRFLLVINVNSPPSLRR